MRTAPREQVAPIAPPTDFYKWLRVHGGMQCRVCKHAYRQHPRYPLSPELNILCNGDLVKL